MLSKRTFEVGVSPTQVLLSGDEGVAGTIGLVVVNSQTALNCGVWLWVCGHRGGWMMGVRGRRNGGWVLPHPLCSVTWEWSVLLGAYGSSIIPAINGVLWLATIKTMSQRAQTLDASDSRLWHIHWVEPPVIAAADPSTPPLSGANVDLVSATTTISTWPMAKPSRWEKNCVKLTLFVVKLLFKFLSPNFKVGVSYLFPRLTTSTCSTGILDPEIVGPPEKSIL